MSRFRHILAPIDFTDKNAAAMEVVDEIAVANHSRVTLLHVIETIDFVEGKELEDFYAMLEARSRQNLNAAANRFVEDGLVVHADVVYGKRAAEIVRYAKEQDVSLIIMSSRPVPLEAPIRGLGTLSQQVAILCHCPVLLVK